MKNSFRIKHGNTAPVFVNGKTSLQPYELGYCDSDEELYLGVPKLDNTIDFKKVGGTVEVGGRNLLFDSQFRKTNNVTGVVVERETGEGVLAFTGGLGITREVFLDIPTYNFPLLQNKKISLSMFGIAINVVKGATNPFIGATLQVGYVGGTFSYFDVGWDELIPDIKWKKMGNTFQILDKTILSMRLRFIGQDFTGTIKIKMPKLEVGNSLTDWSPAPEDIGEGMKDLYQSGRNYFISSQRSIVGSGGLTYEPFNSECPYGFKVTGDQDYTNLLRISNVIKNNGYWTISWDMRGTQSVAVGVSVDICDSGVQRFTTTADNSWKRFSLTVNVTNALTYNFVDFQDFGWYYFLIRNIKIERSLYPSDFTPAPEDIVQKTQENWITPTLLNGWTNYPGNWNTASYMKDELGFVHVRGLVQSGAISTNIFVLPVGYRPLKNYIFTTISNNLIGRVDANPDGGIYAWTPSSNVWLPLDMIYFRAEQ